MSYNERSDNLTDLVKCPSDDDDEQEDVDFVVDVHDDHSLDDDKLHPEERQFNRFKLQPPTKVSSFVLFYYFFLAISALHQLFIL